MRAAGVPARVVTGYQGGELNPVDSIITVRQSDAHAWAEVFLAGRGWVRVDPTAAAVPGRVEAGLARAVPQSAALPLMMRPQLEWLRGAARPLGSGGAQVERVGARLQPGAAARADEPCSACATPTGAALTAALFAFLGVMTLVLLAWSLRRPGAARPGADGVARFLPQARRARRRARRARGSARLRRARGARPARRAHAASCASARCTSRCATARSQPPGGRHAPAQTGARALIRLLFPAAALVPGAWRRPPYAEPARRCRPSCASWRSATASSRASSSACSRKRSARDPCSRRSRAPAERVRTWEEYRAALHHRAAHRTRASSSGRSTARTLERAEKKYGVPPEYVVAIIGVETFYGRNTGNWRVVDALTTLAFDYPPRAELLPQRARAATCCSRAKRGIDVFSVRGSYAGAIGIPQFMPGSTRRYAVDFDGDGKIDLQKSRADAIGSVANFLKVHGWQRDARRGVLEARVAGDAWRALRRTDASSPSTRMAELRAGRHRVRFAAARRARPAVAGRARQRRAAERLPRGPAQFLRHHALQPQRALRRRGRRPGPGAEEGLRLGQVEQRIDRRRALADLEVQLGRSASLRPARRSSGRASRSAAPSPGCPCCARTR